MTNLLNSYPDVTSTLLHRIEAAGGASISIQFTSYNASTGELLFNANSSQVIDIPTYIRSPAKLRGLFHRELHRLHRR